MRRRRWPASRLSARLLAASNGSTAASAPPLDQCRFVAEDFEEFVSEVLGIEWLVGP
jgi:hypothetical protein